MNKLTLKNKEFYRQDNMTGHIFFYLALSFLTMHEMDAIRCREWHIFSGISLLSAVSIKRSVIALPHLKNTTFNFIQPQQR